MRNFNGAAILGSVVLMGWIGTGKAPLFLGTKTPYTKPVAEYLPPPEGYYPSFINYVGRHGARFLTKEGPDVQVLEELETGARDRSLTDTGRLVLSMLSKLYGIQKGRYENITLLGEKEQEAIGRRELENYGKAFTGRGLEIIYTYKVRTKQSADAWLRGFAHYKGERHFSKTTDSLDTLLRFYDLSPAYQKYKKSPVLRRRLDSLNTDRRTLAVARDVCARIFMPSRWRGWREERVVAFVESEQ